MKGSRWMISNCSFMAMEIKYFLRYRCFYVSDFTLVFHTLAPRVLVLKTPQAFLKAFPSQIQANSWEDVMDMIDTNGDGFIRIEELKRWPPNPKQITEYEIADTNHTIYRLLFDVQLYCKCIRMLFYISVSPLDPSCMHWHQLMHRHTVLLR